mmetsp:Transcript_47329/g.115529  ORF Transcript_47329/g.115529 Transcript_47329/m.115529 type:complete len:211 (+) Transcript_47329:85-717(+)
MIVSSLLLLLFSKDQNCTTDNVNVVGSMVGYMAILPSHGIHVHMVISPTHRRVQNRKDRSNNTASHDQQVHDCDAQVDCGDVVEWKKISSPDHYYVRDSSVHHCNKTHHCSRHIRHHPCRRQCQFHHLCHHHCHHHHYLISETRIVAIVVGHDGGHHDSVGPSKYYCCFLYRHDRHRYRDHSQMHVSVLQFSLASATFCQSYHPVVPTQY